MNGIKAALRSTNTTTLGVLAVAAAAIELAQTLINGETPDFNVLGLAIIGLIGILAKDGNKSSQDVGLRP